MAFFSVGGMGIRSLREPLLSFLSGMYFSGFSAPPRGIFILIGDVTELLLAAWGWVCFLYGGSDAM